MDISRFSQASPGKTLQIATHGGWAFLPNRLPPKWEFPLKMWPLLAEVKQKLGELEGVGKSLLNPGIMIKPLINREAIDSSTIEGTYATPQELLLFQMRQGEQGPSLFEDAREVSNYSRAMESAISDESPITIDTLCEMHRVLLTGTRGEDKLPGQIRDRQVAVGNRYRFVPPPSGELPVLLNDLDEDFGQPLSVDPLINAFLVHYQFEAIHPFNDGNGRVGRALLALMIYRNCGFTKPWLYLSSYFEQHRRGYIERLNRISTNGDWDSWIEFCLKATHSQAIATIQKCERVIGLQQDFENRVATAGGSFRLQQVLTRLFERQYMQIPELSEILEVTYPTANSDVEKLVELGILALLDDVSPKTFFSPELFQATYG